MDAAEKLRSDVISIVSSAAHVPKAKVALEKPPKGIPGDLAFPCFSIAKKLRKPPVQAAEALAGKIKPRGLVQRVTQVGPYLNFFADWHALGDLLLKEALKKTWGSGDSKGTVLVEFAHPNTHKSFHIGHVRNIALGEALSRLLEFSGYKVARANYQGDIGPHVAKCLWGLLHLGLKEPPKDRGLWLGTVYSSANKSIKDSKKKEEEVREINMKLYSGDSKLLELWKKTKGWSLEYFDSVYKDFGAKFDRFYFESEVESEGVKLAKILLKKGIAKKSQDAIVMDLKKSDLGIFVLITKDGTPLYSIKDFVLAELQEKEFTPEKIIHVVGTEQNLHFRQLFKSLETISPKIAKKEFHLSYELVTLAEGKMSSREGRLITYDELRGEVLEHALEETKKHSHLKEQSQSASVISQINKELEATAELVALGAIKYDMLKQSPEKTILFDWKQALRFDGNAAPYLQYTHARAHSILAKAESFGKWDSRFLGDPKETAMLRKLLEFPETVHSAARDYRPHYLATYAFELATLFNDFYQNLLVLKAPSGEREARLALVNAVQLTLNRALTLLGIEAPEKM